MCDLFLATELLKLYESLRKFRAKVILIWSVYILMSLMRCGMETSKRRGLAYLQLWPQWSHLQDRQGGTRGKKYLHFSLVPSSDLQPEPSLGLTSWHSASKGAPGLRSSGSSLLGHSTDQRQAETRWGVSVTYRISGT